MNIGIRHREQNRAWSKYVAVANCLQADYMAKFEQYRKGHEKFASSGPQSALKAGRGGAAGSSLLGSMSGASRIRTTAKTLPLSRKAERLPLRNKSEWQ